jgi:leader peptidase (prepilin peptidase)/N-methyltransferase
MFFPWDYVLVVLLSLCVGSFFNVCIYRLPKEKSIVTPRSFCPRCQTPIKWYDNVPVLSYLILQGRCRFCKEPISIQYPLVELITAGIFTWCYHRFGFSPMFFEYTIFFSFCILVSFIDIAYRAIPGWMCIVGMLIGITFAGVETVNDLNRNGLIVNIEALPLSISLVGAVASIGVSYFLKLIGDLFLWVYLSMRKQKDLEGETEALGLGDVDFLGMVGAFLGWKLGVLTFFLAPFISLLYGIYLIVGKKSHLIAYLPFLSIAAFVAAFWGNDILRILFGI